MPLLSLSGFEMYLMHPTLQERAYQAISRLLHVLLLETRIDPFL